MDYSTFSKLVLDSLTSPVVLLEGTRELPAEDAPRLAALAAHLARTFSHARFRTGNAKGSDEAFAAGVISVDPTRLEFVVPYATHRNKQRPDESTTAAIDEIHADRIEDLIETTVSASPQYQRVAVNYRKPKTHPRQRATAQLILRDTLKVVGTESLGCLPNPSRVSSPPRTSSSEALTSKHTVLSPVAGIFYVNAVAPNRGGTGHTIRVCRAQGVPVTTQFDWLNWLF